MPNFGKNKMKAKTFAVDPYYYKRVPPLAKDKTNATESEISKRIKQKFGDLPDPTEEAATFLSQFFGVSRSELYSKSVAYQNNPDALRNFIWVVQYYDNLRSRELTSDATCLPIVIAIFTIDALTRNIPVPKNKPQETSKSEYRLGYFLKNGFNRLSKLELLNSFAFSEEFDRIPFDGKKSVHHLMYQAMLEKCPGDEYISFENEWCSTQGDTGNIHCHCINWLNKQDSDVVNGFIDKLAKYLYKMRCSVVHDSLAALISYTDIKPANVAVWNMTISDVVLDMKKNKHIYYESSLQRQKFEEMFKTSLWNAFCNGLPKVF